MATDVTVHKKTELVRKVQYAVSDEIATAGTLAEIVDAARRELGTLMDTRKFVLAEYDARTKTISAAPFRSGDGKELLSRWSGEKSLTGMVIRNRKAMRFSKSEIRKLADDGAIELAGARAEVWLGAPLLSRDNVFGAIFVQSYDDPKAYDDASMETLQVAANQISVYMEKKRAEEKLRESEETFRTFFEQNCVGFVILTPNGKWLRFNDRFCEMTGYSRPQLEKMTWADFTPQSDCERAFRIYSDAMRSGESGFLDFEKRFVRRDGSMIDVSVSSRLVRRPDGTVKHIASIIQDITERKRFEGLLTRKAEELERHQEAIIASMAILAEYRDHGTGEHVLRTKEYVRLLLERSGGSKLYPPEHLPLLWQAAALHDIGKVGIPDMILLKPGELTPQEFEIAKRHTVIGSEVLEVTTRILGKVPFIAYARQITEFHHEKWDGSGYPNGLKGEEIPFIARVMAIADVYDALVTERPYKKPIPHEEAVAVIAAGAGGHFDPRLVDVFLGCESEFKTIAKRIV
jgi:PAS domain S-box-containing protein